MKRTVKKQFWLSRDEAQELQKKAKRTCLSEAALFRLLVRGFEPKEKPDDRFYDVMRQLSAIGNNLHQITVKANALGLFVLNHGIINPFGSVVFCLYLPLRGCQPDSPLFRKGQRGRHARYAPG